MVRPQCTGLRCSLKRDHFTDNYICSDEYLSCTCNSVTDASEVQEVANNTIISSGKLVVQGRAAYLLDSTPVACPNF